MPSQRIRKTLREPQNTVLKRKPKVSSPILNVQKPSKYRRAMIKGAKSLGFM